MLRYEVWSNEVHACVVVQRRIGLQADSPWAIGKLDWIANPMDFSERMSDRLFVAVQNFVFQWNVLSATDVIIYQQKLEELMAAAGTSHVCTYTPISEALWQRLGKLTQLEIDWGHYGSQPLAPTIVNDCINVLLLAWHYHLPEPFVVPLENGGLELEWSIHKDNDLMIELNASKNTYLIDVKGVEEEGEFEYYKMMDLASRLLNF